MKNAKAYSNVIQLNYRNPHELPFIRAFTSQALKSGYTPTRYAKNILQSFMDVQSGKGGVTATSFDAVQFGKKREKGKTAKKS